jgi:hypothetical protein
MTNDFAALASVRSVGVSSASLVAGTIVWSLFARSAWAKPATVVTFTTLEGTALDSVRSVGMGSKRHCIGGNDR